MFPGKFPTKKIYGSFATLSETRLWHLQFQTFSVVIPQTPVRLMGSEDDERVGWLWGPTIVSSLGPQNTLIRLCITLSSFMQASLRLSLIHAGITRDLIYAGITCAVDHASITRALIYAGITPALA